MSKEISPEVAKLVVSLPIPEEEKELIAQALVSKLDEDDVMEGWFEGFLAATFAIRSPELKLKGESEVTTAYVAMSKTLRASLNSESGVNLAAVINKMLDATTVALVQHRLTPKQ